MENTDLEMFMVKLRWLLYEDGNNTPIGNNPLIEAKKPEIRLLYEQLGHLIGSCFKEQEQHDVRNLKKRLVEAASQAEDIIDMFISSALVWNDDSLRLSYEERVASSLFKDKEKPLGLHDVGHLKRRLINAAHQAKDNVNIFISSAVVKNDDSLRLSYEERASSIFIDEEQLHDLHDVGNLNKRFIEAAQRVADIVDMFISSAVIKNYDSLSLSYEERMPSFIFKIKEQLHGLHDVGNLKKRHIEEARRQVEDIADMLISSAIIWNNDSLRLPYEERVSTSTFEDEEKLHDLHDVGNLKKRLVEATCQAEDIVDMFISSAVTQTIDSLRLLASSFIFKEKVQPRDLHEVENLKKKLLEAAHQAKDIANMFNLMLSYSLRLPYEERISPSIYKNKKKLHDLHDVGNLKKGHIEAAHQARVLADIFTSFVFKDEEQLHDLHDEGNLKKRRIEAAGQAEYIADMFISSTVMQKIDSLRLLASSFIFNVGNLKKQLIVAACQAEDIVDKFVLVVVIKNDDSLRLSYQKRVSSSIIESRSLCYDSEVFPLTQDPNVKHYLLDCSLKNLKDVMDDLKSIRDDIISNNKGNLFQKHFNLQDMMDMKIHEATGTTCSSGNTTVNLRETEQEEFIVGFEDDALLILERLTGDRKKLDIISIVGMGGQGKTALATKIFNDSLVEYHFDKRGWITVSQAYSKRDLLLQLLASMGKSVHESASESKLYEMLYQSLKGLKYLIVIDDIWSCKAWDDVGLCFPDDKTGSRVLLTTRLIEVASHASRGGFTHNLGLLTKDQSWELLCRKTFRGHECPESLTETGKLIARKCAGLPLALVVIAGILEKGEKRNDLWDKIAKRVGSYIINDPVGCLDTLALSYDHLPSELKKCFLYIGGFPEDYKIEVRRLIRLWMAEGFIKKAGQRSLEEEGEYYLMDLIDRNLLVVADKSSNGGVKSCRLHDLLREVCLKKAFEENFFKRVNFQSHAQVLALIMFPA